MQFYLKSTFLFRGAPDLALIVKMKLYIFAVLIEVCSLFFVCN